MRIVRYLILAICTFACAELAAQNTLRGKIVDGSNGDPLIGANILVKGTSEGNVTDFDGFFEVKTSKEYPITIIASYLGYDDMEMIITDDQGKIDLRLVESSVTVDVVEVKASRISEETKKSPLTIEALDALAIKETPAPDFYSGLGALKGVDLTTASLGFTVINTRGFNSTSPVRSLQTIDGMDNQSPGLNFSLGNFLGSSELDINKVDLVVGASSAFYGPNAFNGVIAMETKNPFFHKGLSASIKIGERQMRKGELRWAQDFKDKNGNPWFAYKLNGSYMQAQDWVADNYDPISDVTDGNVFNAADNPGRTNAVNIYGDESFTNQETSIFDQNAGLNRYYRTGYKEEDLVDYDTENTKLNASFHFRLLPSQGYESPELMVCSSFGSGTTVYQGDNRFSLKGITFYQNRIELRKKDKWFIRAYATNEDAGDSYDPYFTALKIQEFGNTNENWANNYRRWWTGVDLGDVFNQMKNLGYPSDDTDAQIQWQNDNRDSLISWHSQAAQFANSGLGNNATSEIPEPGSPLFDSLFQEITTRKNNDIENGTRFSDRSALYHVHGEYHIPTSFFKDWGVGANFRLYKPNTEGTIFDDALNRISNSEYGVYTGGTKEFGNFQFSASIRMDKNQNFNHLFSPAASVVWNPQENTFIRASFSSAIRNPTLSDQYLNLNVGPATLLGNITGYENLVTLESFQNNQESANEPYVFKDINPVTPEKVKTFELGGRTAILGNLFLDGSVYTNIYDDFLGYEILLDVPFDTVKIFGLPDLVIANLFETEVFRVAANSSQQVVSRGAAIGFNYYFSNYSFAGNYSYNSLVTEETDDIVPAYNTPEHKFNISFGGRGLDILGKDYAFGFNVNYKWIEGFIFEGSPQFTGNIPTYDMLDAQVNFELKKYNTILKIGASNILDNQQFQTYGGPRIGRMAYISLTYDLKEKF